MAMTATTGLTNVQVELLKLYATNLPEQDLDALKRLLARFFAQRAVQAADRLWDERHLTQNDMDEWLTEAT